MLCKDCYTKFMKLISLTQGQSAKVDDEDFARFGHLKWCAQWHKKEKVFYAVRKNNKKILLLHREILGLTDPRIKGDHINHDTLDCQSRNLRPATNAQNTRNKKGANSTSKTGIRGVWWVENRKKFSAGIHVDGKSKHLGYFSDTVSASSAYAAANHKYFGAFGGQL